jgi:hypothetical protein
MRMRRPSVRRVAAVLAPWAMLCATAAGCNNLLGIAGWRDVPGDASPSEAGTVGSEAGATADAAGTTACNAAQGDAGDWCEANAPGVTFCDDFDHGAAVGTGWTYKAPDEGDGGLDSLDPYTPPSDFFAITPALDAGYAQWFLSKALIPPPAGYTNLTFSFDVRVQPFPPNDPATVVLAVILLGGEKSENANGYSVSIVEGAGGVLLDEHLAVTEAGPDPLGIPLTDTPSTSWTRFRLEMTLSTPPNSGGQLKVFQTDLPAFPSGSHPCPPVTITHHTITSPAAYGPPQFNLGQVFVGGPSAAEGTRFDDVIIDMY